MSAPGPDADGLTPDELSRYSRHLLLAEVGREGQRRLKGASVLVAGAGGLGSPVALYLAAAGVGRISVADFDTVDASNLQRQVLYETGDVGRSKARTARARLLALNPSVAVEALETRLDERNAPGIVRGHDLVVDCTDSFRARYLINDACVRAGRPDVYGSVHRFEGQVAVFAAKDGPCYRCLHPQPPPPEAIPTCSEGGVLGVLPGIIGSLQAAEALKLILGIGKPLVGRLLLFDALTMEATALRLRRDPDCPACSPAADPGAPRAAPPEISAAELAARLAREPALLILDVREPHERALGRIPGSRSIPLGSLAESLDGLDPAGELVVYCRSGARSASAVALLRGKGFLKAVGLEGGILAWAGRPGPGADAR